jgi:hypothetical protein
MSVTATTRSRTEGGTLPARFTPRALAARLEPVPGGLALLGEALSSSGQCAALWILTGLRRDDARIWGHVSGGRIEFAAILGELAQLLDEELWHAVLEALRIRRADWCGGGW